MRVMTRSRPGLRVPAWAAVRAVLVGLCLALAVLAVTASQVGCVGPSVRADSERVDVAGGPHNVARQGPDTWMSAFQGVHPTNTVIDDAGANVQTGGPNTVLGVVLGETPKLFTSNPSDTTIDRLVYGPDGTITIEGFSSLKSSVVAAYDRQVIAWAQTQGVITDRQAAVAMRLVDAGASVFEALALAAGL